MSEHTAFLAAICANRADDTPRLVYADWLDEHGEPERAEFIRVQCELARIPAGGGEGHSYADCLSPSTCEKCLRLDDLRRREQDLWNGDNRGAGRDAGVAQDFIKLVPEGWQVRYWMSTAAHPPYAFVRRGFIDTIRGPAVAILGRNLSTHPITNITLTDYPPENTRNEWTWDNNKWTHTDYPGIAFHFPPESDETPDEWRFPGMYEAGKRAGMERQRRFLEAFLGDSK